MPGELGWAADGRPAAVPPHQLRVTGRGLATRLMPAAVIAASMYGPKCFISTYVFCSSMIGWIQGAGGFRKGGRVEGGRQHA